jgi:hypothetical protein
MNSYICYGLMRTDRRMLSTISVLFTHWTSTSTGVSSLASTSQSKVDFDNMLLE